MDPTESILAQVGVTTNRSRNQMLHLYNICDSNFRRLVSLEETIKKNYIHSCPETKEDVSKILKIGKDDRYFFMRAFVNPANRSTIIVQNKVKSQIISIPGAIHYRPRGYKYSVEVHDAKLGWQRTDRYFETPVSLNHWSLNCEGIRRNARCEETCRIDRINFDEYTKNSKLEYEHNYDTTKPRMPGLEIHIIAGDIFLLNKY